MVQPDETRTPTGAVGAAPGSSLFAAYDEARQQRALHAAAARLWTGGFQEAAAQLIRGPAAASFALRIGRRVLPPR
jgi:hypothetical protein